MKERLSLFAGLLIISLVISACAAPSATTSPAPATSTKAQASGAPATSPVLGGIMRTIKNRPVISFGYPPKIEGSDADYVTPMFERLLSVGEGGVYQPELATSWETSADGKAITLKLRSGVKFHDGTDFNAQAVKANFDRLIPPNPVVLAGITSIEALDPLTVRVNLAQENNLVLYQIASTFQTYIASPTAIEKNGADWATTHPVATGPFAATDYDRNVGLTFAKNTNYWDKTVPYLEGQQVLTIIDPMTAMAAFKRGEANIIYDAAANVAAQLRDEGYPLQINSGGFIGLGLDTRTADSIWKNKKLREALEYAIDREGITSGPGLGFYTPTYQIVQPNSPDICSTCAPRKYDPAKAKQLLAEAGYANGFSFKGFFQDTTWRDGVTMLQQNFASVGITMDVNLINAASYGALRAEGKIEAGGTLNTVLNVFSNNLFTIDTFLRSDAPAYQFITRPAGTDQLISQAKLAKDLDSKTKLTQQIVKAFYDDITFIPLWTTPRIVVLDKSVQNMKFFINSDPSNHKLGRTAWLSK